MGFTLRRAERRRRAWRHALAVLFILGLTLGTYYGLHSPYFHLARVEVHGLQTLTEAEILQWIGLSRPYLLWQINDADLVAHLEKHPRIAGAEVAKKWPDTLTVNLLERTALAYIEYDDGWLAVDGTGLPFAFAHEPPADQLLIKGLSLKEQRLGRQLPYRAQGALLCAMYIHQYDLNWVKEVHAEVGGPLALILDGGIPVRLGASGAHAIQDQLAVLEALWAQWQADLEQVVYFDVSNAQRPAVKVVETAGDD